MCNLYESTPREVINQRHRVALPDTPYAAVIAPMRQAPFVKARSESAVGQWGMIPATSSTSRPVTSAGKSMSTNNARSESMAKAWTYRFAWSRGQRCLIPATSYDEPYWGTGKNIWWRFWRADGQPWALAGIWSEWTDLATGEVLPNFTMITQNCDTHPLLNKFHKPDPKLPSDAQDKRAVVPVEKSAWDQWLHGNQEQAQDLIRLPSMDLFQHCAADPAKAMKLP